MQGRVRSDTADAARRDAAVYALTARGVELAQKLLAATGGELYAPRRLAEAGGQSFESLPAVVADTYALYRAHIFISAAGIAVRAVAPHLRGKDADPAVVVVTEDGRHVIPILSGHLGGANDLARRIAGITGGQAIITTATDLRGMPAIDLLAQRAGLRIANVPLIKSISAAMLQGTRIAVFDPYDCLRLGNDGDAGPYFEMVASPQELPARPRADAAATHDPVDVAAATPGVYVHWKALPPHLHALALHPPALAVGVGCRKGTPMEDILELIHSATQAASLAPESIALVASVDIKAREPGLLAAAHALGAHTAFYTTAALGAVATPTKSAAARKHVGIDSVSEAAAILASAGGRLLVTKKASRTATVAIALRSTPWAA